MTIPKIPVAVRVLLFAFVLIAIAFVFVRSRDHAPIDDSDLVVPQRSVDPDQNPYPEIRELVVSEEKKSALDRVHEMLRGKEALDVEFVDSVLDDFEEELTLFDQFAAMTDWKDNGEFRFDARTDEHLDGVRTIALLKKSEIRRHQRQGDNASAIKKTLLMIQFGQGLQHCDGTMIHYLLGKMVILFAHGEIIHLVENGELDLDELESLAQRLDQFKFGTKTLETALRSEYQMISALLEDFASGKVNLSELNGDASPRTSPIPPNLLFKLNRTRKIQAEIFRAMIHNVPLIRKDAPHVALDRAHEFVNNKAKLYFGGNPVGEILLAMVLPAYKSILDIPAQTLAEHNLVRLRVAMERYRLSKGDWPADLESLVPEFIDQVPIDQFDGESLRYNRETLKIYSVGRDFIDSGGETKKAGLMRDRDEIVIELERDPTTPG